MLRRSGAVGLVVGLVAIGVCWIGAAPAEASDSGAGIEISAPDAEGHTGHCNVAAEGDGGGPYLDFGEPYTVSVKCQSKIVAGWLPDKVQVNVKVYDEVEAGDLAATGIAYCFTGPSCWTEGLPAGQSGFTFTADWDYASGYVHVETALGCAIDYQETPGVGYGQLVGTTVCEQVTGIGATTTMPSDYFTGGSVGDVPMPLDEVTEYPDYTCARWLDNLGGDHWRVTAVASENAPRENVTTEGVSVEFGAMAEDYFHWYVEFEDPGSNDVSLAGDGRTAVEALGPKIFDLDVSDDGAEVDIANGYGIGFIVRRVTETGSAFKRPIPKTIDDPEEDAFIIERVGDHEEAIGYCDLHVKLDEPGLGAIGTTQNSASPPNAVQWADDGSGSLAACVPSGFGILNPAALVAGLGCVLRWAFIPSADQTQGVLTDFEETYSERFPFSMIGAMITMVDTTIDAATDGLSANTCPHVDFRTLNGELEGYAVLDVRAPTPTGSGCTGAGGVAGDVGGFRTWLRTGSRFGLWFLVMLGLSRKVGPKEGPVMGAS